MKVKELPGMIVSVIKDVIHHWNIPAKKKYVPYKEMAAYSIGGIGVQFVLCMIGQIAMSAGNLLVGASIGITVLDMQTINVVATVIGFFTAPARAMIYDNTKSKMGKFRPYLLYMGIPSAVLYMLFVFMPYEQMDYAQKFATVLIIYNLLQLCSPFYTTAYSCLVQVMSPDTKERAWIIEISSFIYSLAPTIVNPVMPLIGALDDIGTYRKSAPIFCLIGLALSMICVFGTKEKVIVPKRYVPKVGFFEGLRKVCKNKYFWILNGSSWINFLSGGYGSLFQWIFYYGMNNSTIYALMVLIRGEASVPGMLLGAPLVNKFGKRKVCLFSLICQIICMTIMLFCFDNYILAFIMMFLKDIFGAVSIVYTPAMKADIIDYQQYKTGDRLEGFIDQTGVLFGSIIGIGTGYVIPYILKLNGLTDNYSDLYNADFRNPIVEIMIFLAIVGTILSLIPFLFYDLNEDKRSGMIKVLKLRALLTDYHHGDMTEENLIDTVEEINTTLAYLNQEKQDKPSKKEKGRIVKAKIVYNELYKYDTPEMRRKIEDAQKYLREHPDVQAPDAGEVKKAMELPDETRAQQKEKKRAIKEAEKVMEQFAKANKKYVDAQKTITDYEISSNWDELVSKYNALVTAHQG